MREPLFIKKNIDRWQEYDNFETNDPDELSDRFLHIMDDLSYAQTFYPRSKTHKYLNERAASFYNEIYKRKRNKFSTIFYFWKYDLPLIIKKRQRYLVIALIVFFVFCLIGWFSVVHNPAFLDTALNPGYVDMTRDNIAEGNPFKVYSQQEGEFAMFLHIFLNNIRVSLLTFVSGLFASIGSVYLLFKNGLMLGAFQKIFFMYPDYLGWKSILVIWIHGVLEISAIIISGGAGILLGNSFLFPGTYTRLNSLKKAAIDGAKIMMGITPILFIAALLESYVTRMSSRNFSNTDFGLYALPIPVSIAILAISLIFIVWYFIIYPTKVENHFLKMQNEHREHLVVFEKNQ
jgi:uncharacterized membrane protein SpoIIM required for sporulation